METTRQYSVNMTEQFSSSFTKEFKNLQISGGILLTRLSCMITYLTSQLFSMYWLSLAHRALLGSSSVRTGVNNQASLSTWSLSLSLHHSQYLLHKGTMCLNQLAAALCQLNLCPSPTNELFKRRMPGTNDQHELHVT